MIRLIKNILNKKNSMPTYSMKRMLRDKELNSK